ncbi:MAG: chloride channel protein [Austwickia sp.]|nr:chloride channel protein [Austwickia sp.]
MPAQPLGKHVLATGFAVLLGGLAAGIVGAAMTWLLLRIQALTYGVESASLLAEVRAASDVRRVLGPLIGGLLAGLGWWWLRGRGPVTTVEAALEVTAPRALPLRRTLADAVLQILVVGSGASIGREGAPRQAAAAMTQAIAGRLAIPDPRQRTLVACAAGAGLAAVYNVPVAGAVFAVEVLRTPRRWGTVACAAAMSAVATVTAWPVVTNRPTYDFPAIAADPAMVAWSFAWALTSVPVVALTGRAFTALAGRARRHAVAPRVTLPLAVGASSALVGLAAVALPALPALPGNGKDILQLTFSAEGTLPLFLILLVLKPLATALCLRSGAVGGLLTPALATGAALGGAVALAVHPLAAAAPLPVFALLAAAGVLAVTQRAPLFAVTMTWELTHAPIWTIPLLCLTAYGAHWAYKGCSARLHGGS